MRIHCYEKFGIDHYVTSYMVAFTFTNPNQDIEIAAWCRDTFGPSGGEFGYTPQPGYRWRNGIPYGEVDFANEEDRIIFILKWS